MSRALPVILTGLFMRNLERPESWDEEQFCHSPPPVCFYFMHTVEPANRSHFLFSHLEAWSQIRGMLLANL